MERYGWTPEQIGNLTWPQIRMAMEQRQGDQGSAKGDKLKRFTGPDCWKELDAWNQRRQLTGRL